MDQVGCADLPGTISIGGYRYAIVFCKVSEDYWDFLPVKSMSADWAERCFAEFCSAFTDDVSLLVCYCDNHPSLLNVANRYNMSRFHPPPGRPQANSVIERKIGIALQGVRAALASGCLPNCFWNFAGHCFAFNDNLSSRKGDRVPPYTLLTGDEWKGPIFTCGELVFFKPAKTITKHAKLDPRLVPGIFLDYFRGRDGRFSGQYVVCDLSDFCGKNLHHRVPSKHFKLHLHRTEVVRLPVGVEHSGEPIYPTRERFYKVNFTIEGVEKKNRDQIEDEIDLGY